MKFMQVGNLTVSLNKLFSFRLEGEKITFQLETRDAWVVYETETEAEEVYNHLVGIIQS